MKIGILVYFSLLGVSVLPAGANPKVGAIRWDPWNYEIWNRQSVIFPNLTPTQWEYRLPFYADTTTRSDPKGIHIWSDTTAAVEQEITYAVSNKLDYWAWYYTPTIQAEHAFFNGPLDVYMASSRKGEIEMAIILGHAGDILFDATTWDGEADILVSFMQQPNYLKVLEGRPVIFIYRNAAQMWNFSESTALATLRTKATAANLANPYIVTMYTYNSNYDAISFYSAGNGTSTTTGTYADLITANYNAWETHRSAGRKLIPTVNIGWGGPRHGATNHGAQPTIGQWRQNLEQATEYLANYPINCEAGLILTYAWNEYDEGGALNVTLGDGTAMLQEVKGIKDASVRTVSVTADQTANGGQWRSLGSYPFERGTSAFVVVRNNDTNGYVVADAIKFSKPGESDVIVDNTDPVVDIVGSWTSSTGAGFYGSNYLHDANTEKDGRFIRFTPHLPASGIWEVFAWWTAHSNRATNAVYDVRYHPLADEGEIVLDTEDGSGVTITGSWPTSYSSNPGVPGYNGADYVHDVNASKGSKSVTFTPAILTTQVYDAYVRWTSASNRATNVPVDAISDSGSTTVSYNQIVDGGAWQIHGTYQFNANDSGYIRVRNQGTNGYVVADAIRLVPSAINDQTFEIEDVTYGGTGASATIVSNASYSGGHAVSINSDSAGDRLSITFNLARSGTYRVRAYVRTHSSRGRYSLTATRVEHDLYVAPGSEAYQVPMDFGLITWSTTGSKTVRFDCAGKNPSASGYSGIFDKIVLEHQ